MTAGSLLQSTLPFRVIYLLPNTLYSSSGSFLVLISALVRQITSLYYTLSAGMRYSHDWVADLKRKNTDLKWQKPHLVGGDHSYNHHLDSDGRQQLVHCKKRFLPSVQLNKSRLEPQIYPIEKRKLQIFDAYLL